jgi:hypothetical protein
MQLTLCHLEAALSQISSMCSDHYGALHSSLMRLTVVIRSPQIQMELRLSLIKAYPILDGAFHPPESRRQFTCRDNAHSVPGKLFLRNANLLQPKVEKLYPSPAQNTASMCNPIAKTAYVCLKGSLALLRLSHRALHLFNVH